MQYPIKAEDLIDELKKELSTKTYENATLQVIIKELQKQIDQLKEVKTENGKDTNN